jgi:hypothetical protein
MYNGNEFKRLAKVLLKLEVINESAYWSMLMSGVIVWE